MKGEEDRNTQPALATTCGDSQSGIFTKEVEEGRAEKNGVKSGEPRHKENQAQVQESTLYSGRFNDLGGGH